MKVTRAEKRRQARVDKKASKKQIPICAPKNLDGYWIYKGDEDPKIAPPKDVPGVNFRPLDPQHDEMVLGNKWFDSDKFPEWVETIQLLSNEEPFEKDGNTLKPGCVNWSWTRNWDCKYLDIRIDMRDGGFVVMDQEGKRISLAQLKWQYQFKKDLE